MTVGRCSHAWTFGHPFTWLLFVSLSVSIKCSISFTLLLHSLLLCFSASLPPSAAFCSPSSVLHLPQSTRMGMMEGSRSKKKVIPARGRIKRRIFACFFRKLKLIRHPPFNSSSAVNVETLESWGFSFRHEYYTKELDFFCLLWGLLFYYICSFFVFYFFSLHVPHLICMILYCYEMNVRDSCSVFLLILSYPPRSTDVEHWQIPEVLSLLLMFK